MSGVLTDLMNFSDGQKKGKERKQKEVGMKRQRREKLEGEKEEEGGTEREIF